MPGRRLPPLNALKAFEVVARHMSFRNAADELCVTSTAVSHRIRSLEEWLGVKLFNRLTRSLELTKEGEAYAPLIREGFTLLASASDALNQSSEGGDLVISTTMSFASNWLSPKLPFFYEQHEDLRLRVEGSDLVTDFTRTNIDVAIRYGEGGYEDLHSEMLFTDLVTPVCAPELAARAKEPADLLALPRLDYQWAGFREQDPSWEKWFRAAGVENATPDQAPIFSEEHMVLSQAIAGRGTALVGIVAAAEAIEEGALVRLFPIALENRSYYFVCQSHALNRHKVRVFHDWLKDEAICFDTLGRENPKLRFETVVRSETL
jgi:LysR family glycine cleavage system transcriptional activator